MDLGKGIAIAGIWIGAGISVFAHIEIAAILFPVMALIATMVVSD